MTTPPGPAVADLAREAHVSPEILDALAGITVDAYSLTRPGLAVGQAGDHPGPAPRQRAAPRRTAPCW